MTGLDYSWVTWSSTTESSVSRVSSGSSTKPESSGTGVCLGRGIEFCPYYHFPYVSGFFVGNEGWFWENFPELFIALNVHAASDCRWLFLSHSD